jgi:hypothetical protein
MLEFGGVGGVIVGGLSALATAALGLYFSAPHAARVRDESAIKPGVRDHDSTVVESVQDGRPRPARGQGDPDPGRGIAVENVPVGSPHASYGAVFMDAQFHIEPFLEYLLYDEDGVGHRYVGSDRHLFYAYQQWSTLARVAPIPKKTLETLIGKRKGQVKKDRPIKKDPTTGRCLYHATGSPDRWTRYVISPPRAEVLPGKVPVADLVPVRTLPPKKKSAGLASEPLPERIAA